MRILSSSLGSRAGNLAALLLASTCFIGTSAINFTSIPSPNLDLSALGRVAFAGDFDSISLYQYQGQSESSSGTNGALLARYPNGAFATLSQTDADIKAMCAFQANGTLQGIVFGGNFTSVGDVHTPGGIALLNPDTGLVSPLEGLNGTVSALYCDADAGRVYIGGSFTGGNANNAIVWITGWTNMPFSGFNGPVNTITKANGNIIFGGKFNGLGNTTAPKENTTQVVPLASANLTAQTSSGLQGLTDPKNIICKTGDQDGPGNTWLLSDTAPGFWRADFGFGFQPSKLRLYNTKYQGRGTKTWRFTRLPDGGIMNFTYTDPTSGAQSFCDATCPLPQNNVSAQDFTFVNQAGMNGFRIDISEWYGSGAGLSGIELFQDDIYSFAINDFNEPQCDGVSNSASATTTGTAWVVSPSQQSNSEYLSATLTGTDIDPSEAVVVFQPNIPQSGNYSVTMYTPGCQGDNTCSLRGRVNVTGSMTSSTDTADTPLSTELYQTNTFDKYDRIYYGYVDATSSFKPSVTLQPMPGQNGPLVVVAQRVRFELLSATSGNLNGLFEYNPNEQTVDSDFTKSAVDVAGASLSPKSQATITTLAADNDRIFVGGNFSGNGFSNFFAINKTNATSLPGEGLNSQVMTIYQNGSTLYVGGNFTNTQDNKSTGLNGVASFTTADNTWHALGAGVNGVVMSIVPFSLNLTSNKPEQVLAISGFFDTVNSAGTNASFAANDFAIWVPSRNNWLHNLNVSTISIGGTLMAYTDVPGQSPLFAGSISSGALGASGAVAYEYGNNPSLESFGLNFVEQQTSGSLRKRALPNGQNSSGIVAATFYKENSNNKTILAGNFEATASDGSNITNLLIIDSKNNNQVTGLHDEISSDSTFKSLDVLNNVLFAGGSVTGTVNNGAVGGIIAYDLSAGKYTAAQPPALQGINVTVNAIAFRPKSKDVYVGGQFESAGSLSCPSLCVWSTDRNQWNVPGGDLDGTITSMSWISDTKLVLAGNLTSGNNHTTIMTFDSSSKTFAEFTGASGLPGPVTSLCAANSDASEFWAAGQATDGSAFLQRFDGKNWLDVNGTFGAGTIIQGIQVLSLSDGHEHDKSDKIDTNQDLLILGSINVTNFGTASGALYNGTTLQPFLLSTTAENEPGSLSQVFVENPASFFKKGAHHLALGFIVLIALAIALALTFLLVVAGILLEWYRKKSKGYERAPTHFPDRSVTTGRIPPEHLFGTLSGPRAPAI